MASSSANWANKVKDQEISSMVSASGAGAERVMAITSIPVPIVSSVAQVKDLSVGDSATANDERQRTPAATEAAGADAPEVAKCVGGNQPLQRY